MEREEELVLNPYYRTAIADEETEGFTTIGNLFAGLDLQGLALA